MITDAKSKKTFEIVVAINTAYLSTLCNVMVDMEANHVELLKGLLILDSEEVQ